jgi:hypothetical protein
MVNDMRVVDADELKETLVFHEEEYTVAAHRIIDMMPTIEPKQEWISVKDRLPEFGEEIYRRKNTDTVLAWDGYEYVMGYFTRFSLFDEVEFQGVDEDGNYMVKNPTHWMPLPEPPEKNNEEEQA